MGQIHNLKLSRSIGDAQTLSELSLDVSVDELTQVISALDSVSCCPNERFEWKGPPREPDTCDVPRLSMEQEICEGPRIRFDDLTDTPQFTDTPSNVIRGMDSENARVRNLLDAARGAAVLLAGALGMDEPGAEMPIHTILKQANARATRFRGDYVAMDAEMVNLVTAMYRFGFPPVEGLDRETQSIPRQMQSVAHHFDVLKRHGGSVNSGLEVESLPRTREELMAVMGKLQQDAMRAVIDVALIDGFITKDMDPKQATAGAMRWAAAEDSRRKKEAEAKEPEPAVPMTETEAVSAARDRQRRQQQEDRALVPSTELTAPLLAEYLGGRRVDGGE